VRDGGEAYGYAVPRTYTPTLIRVCTVGWVRGSE